jgi:hypothetical protein
MDRRALTWGCVWGVLSCGAPPAEPPTPEDTPDTPPPTETDPPDTDPPPPDSDPPSPTSPPDTVGHQVLREPYCLEPSLRVEARFRQRTLAVSANDEDYVAGAGLAVGDVNGDGHEDLIVVRQREATLYLRDAIGDLREQPPLLRRNLTGPEGLFSATLVDYDGDVDLDVFITSYPGPSVLLRNDGPDAQRGVAWVDVTAEAGVAGPPTHHSTASSWGDLDLDGDLDVVIGGHGFLDEGGSFPVDALPTPDPTLLFLNQGDGTFVDASDRLPPEAQAGYTFEVAIHDLDRDGLPDLYFGNDFAATLAPSEAFRNVGGAVFAAGQLDPALRSVVPGMGLAIGDVNGDGFGDVFLPGWGNLGLLMSFGGAWYDNANAVGVWPNAARKQRVAWGPAIEDMDCDGDLDIVAAFGFLETRFGVNEPGQASALFQQVAPLVFQDRAADWGVNQTDPARTVVVTDINEDGWPDILRSQTDGALRVFESICGERAWLAVRLSQDGLNRHAIGAEVAVRTGDVVQRRWVVAGGHGYGGSSAPVVRFGLDTAQQVDEVAVLWPDGAVDRVYDLPTHREILLTRGSAPAP